MTGDEPDEPATPDPTDDRTEAIPATEAEAAVQQDSSDDDGPAPDAADVLFDQDELDEAETDTEDRSGSDAPQADVAESDEDGLEDDESESDDTAEPEDEPEPEDESDDTAEPEHEPEPDDESDDTVFVTPAPSPDPGTDDDQAEDDESDEDGVEDDGPDEAATDADDSEDDELTEGEDLERPDVYGDRYELRQLVATGGMAEVFLAHDRLLDRPVAVKRLYSEFAADDSFVERFEREAKAVAKLNHPNIVSVYDWGVEGDTQYLVMEYVKGRTLAEILHAEGRLHPDRAADIAIDVAAALTLAHRAGMVHKDIKAGNIMITDDGRVQVLDFGIARAMEGSDESLTESGTVMGTATYFSPEQAQGLQVGPRGDLYSLGVVLYEATVGRPPFTGKTPVAIAYKHVRDAPPAPTGVAPDVPAEIEAITLKLLAKDPDDRYPTAEDLRADLRRFREGHRMGSVAEPVPAPIPDPTPAPKPEIPDYEESPRRTGVFLFFLIVLLLVVTAGLFLWAQTLSDPEATVTDSRTDVPDVIGETAEVAANRLEEAGFEVAQEDARSDTVEAGLVVRLDPAEGTRQEDGSTVTMTVSIGAGTLRLPSVETLTEFAAKRDLEALGLQVRTENREDTSRPEGIVISQSPAAGAEVEQGSTVLLQVSRGADLLALPDVAGLERQPAEELLGIIGCVVTEVLSEESADVTAGQAIRTDPAAGTGVTQGSCSVVLVMSTGAGAQDPNDVGDQPPAVTVDPGG